jgi:SSS family solute:Na+ symporter
VNAITFAVSTLILSGVSMYGMGLVFHDLLGWNMTHTIWLSAFIVLLYTLLGGLTSSIYNEVLQFFLIVLGIVPLVIVGLIAVGGWHNLAQHMPSPEYMHTWAGTNTIKNNTMHIQWQGLVLGLGFVSSFGYWCTDFLVVQRALAAKDINAAMRTPIIAAVPKTLFPFVVILPGVIAIALFPNLGQNPNDPSTSFNNALPLLMGHFYPAGMLGLGLTALLASFMSGMAGNTTAFNTVFTYDLYQAYLVKNQPDHHYLVVGRIATVAGILISIATAYMAMQSKSIMDFVQTVFGFVNAPLLGTFLFGMFWKRTSPWGGFWGLLAGIGAAVVHFMLTADPSPHFHMPFYIHYFTAQAGNFWRAFVSFVASAIVTPLVSLVTKPKPAAELRGLVYSETPKPESDAHLPWYQRPLVLGLIVLGFAVIINLIFW